MTEAAPKICFRTEVSGQTVRVWGAADEVELTPGMWPNVVALRTPKHEFAKFGGDALRSGALELYWSDPATPAVTLEGWFVDHTEDSAFGKEAGAATAEVLEKTIYLTDRRWEFLDGRGGHAWLGLKNRSLPDGSGVAGLGYSPFTCVHMLDDHLRYASGLPRFQSDGIPPAMDALPKPRDLKWDGIHVPTELQRILDECEAVWLLRTDGEYRLAMIGDGEAPELPAADALPSSDNQGRGGRPPVVVVSSAPTRAIDEETLTGPGTDSWEFVGLEPDGSVKAVSLLSYVLGSGMTAVQLVRSGFAGLTSQAYALATSSMYTMVRLAGAGRTGRLPILARRCATVTDADETVRPLPVRVRAKAAQYRDGGWYNSAEFVEIPGCSVDPVHGIVTFPYTLGRVLTDGAARLDASFVALGAGDLEITFAHESAAAGRAAYYVSAWTLDANGQVAAKDVDEALGEGTPDARVLSLPELQEYRVAGVSQNAAALDAHAAALAGRILREPTAVRTYRYRGFHAVELSGTVGRVRWDLRAGLTEYEYRTYFIAKNRYLDRRTLAATAREARAAATATVAAPRQIRDGGGRDFAQPSPVMPGRPIPQAGGTGAFAALLTPGTHLNGAGTGHATNPSSRWGYTFTEARKTASQGAANGGWTAVAGGRSGTAYNAYEIGNPEASDTTTPLGIGPTWASLRDDTGTFYPLPVRAKLVWVTPHTYDAGGTPTVEYWFAESNGIDGGCAE